MLKSSAARITFLACLSLCLATPAMANRRVVKAPTKGNTSKQIKRGAVVKTFTTGVRTRSAGQVRTTLKTHTTASGTKNPGLVRVSDKASVNMADSAVIAHLAAPLSMRGPKANRLSGEAATAKINKQWKITDTRIVANADPGVHPITGNATVIVSASRAPKGTVAKVFNAKKRREFIVNIGTDGKATVLGDRSGAAGARLLRLANEKLAVSRIVRDVISSSGVRKGAASMGVLALAVLVGNSGMSDFATQMMQQFQMLGPVVITAAAIGAKNGMGRRTTARLHAFEALTNSFDVELKAGKTITVAGAYARYKTALKEVRVGSNVTKNVKAPSREHFVKALAVWEASRNTAPLAN